MGPPPEIAASATALESSSYYGTSEKSVVLIRKLTATPAMVALTLAIAVPFIVTVPDSDLPSFETEMSNDP